MRIPQKLLFLSLSLLLIISSDLRRGTRSVVYADGTFAPPVLTNTFTPSNVQTGSGPGALAAGDFNGDNKLDIVVTDRSLNSASVFLNNGSAQFALQATLGTGANPGSVATGDFNNDGNADIVTSNQDANNVSVFLNTGSATFGSPTNVAVGTTFTVVNNTTITVIVPAGAKTGVIKVTAPAGTATSAGSFTVTP